MKITPTLEECKKIAAEESYGVIPISTEMYADMTTPIEVLRILKKVSGHVYLLESAEADKRWGRYSFLGYDPLLEITCYNGMTTIKSELTSRTDSGDVRGIIRNVMEENKSPKLPGLPSFTGGLVGYFSYDYIKYSEPTLRLDAKDEEGFQDVNLMLFHKVIAFDNYRQKLILILNIKTDDLEINYHRAERELNNMKELLLNGEKAEHIPCKLRTDFQPLFNEAAYCSMVEKAKHYIREGDIFQVVLSNRLEAEMEGSLLDAYRVLRTTNPSPYMFYFSGSDGEIVGASPETLVKLEDGVLHTFPLAGTRPRGATEEADKALEAELLADEKERSEHNMLVDLGRNDIGKISRIGTVEVEKYMSIERYSHVMHIGSTVRGVIREDADALDAVDAILPAGTLSGAPKLRACEIINELEDNKRGIYGGAIGYISFTGNLDTCIAIRLAFSKNGKVFVRSGAGIVVGQCTGEGIQGMHSEGSSCKTGTTESTGGNGSMILLIDNYDSFSYNVYQLVGSVNPDIRVIRNDECGVDEIRAMNPSHIILSPGPGRPDKAGVCENVIRELGGRIPILGICLGHQAICEVAGATVTYASHLMHGKQSLATLDTDSVLFRGMKKVITVARYHSLVADPQMIPAELKVTAVTEDGEVMAVEQTEKQIYGVQFHPESVLTPDGRQIIVIFYRHRKEQAET